MGRIMTLSARQAEPSLAVQDPKTVSVEPEFARLTIFLNGILEPVAPARAEHRARIIALAAREYQRCHPDDSFENLVARARFSKEDTGLLRDWLAAFEYATDPHRRE